MNPYRILRAGIGLIFQAYSKLVIGIEIIIKFLTFSSSARILTMILLVTSIFQIGVSTGIMNDAEVVNHIGIIKTVGVNVYKDSVCRIQMSSIDWGMFEPGSKKSLSVYIKNEGNAKVTLSLLTEDWNPESVAEFISLDWDYNGQQLNPDQVQRVTLTLYVKDSTREITNFGFSTVIIAQG